MAQLGQVAVAGPSALATPSHLASKSQPHNIPRFLLKLYEIVNDPANESLVKWSEAGDSFFILDQERFARELLGKWFKHQNFSSFVRQLNLYGFRKISALQQGALRNEMNVDTVQFAHPHFHRGQPDLLALIQRRRQPTAHSHTDDSATALLQPSQDNQDQSQAVDVRSIIDGINAIRRQQQAIAADLGTLKQSNDALWKEAIEARERHAKHEDTINRILKFLAGLFGRVLEGQRQTQTHGDGNAVAPRRLMIGDGRASHGEGGDYFGDDDAESRSHTPLSIASERFATIETPAASVASPAPTSSISELPENVRNSPPKPSQPLLKPRSQQPADQSMKIAAPLPVAATTFTAPSGNTAAFDQGSQSPDAMWQATFHQMLSSPAHFQRILQSFAKAQPYNTEQDANSLGLFAPVAAPAPAPAPAPDPSQQLTYPAAPLPPQQSQPLVFPDAAGPLSVGPTLSSDLDFQNAALLANAAHLNKTYQDASEIDADVNKMQSNLHALVRDMGLDPNNMAFPAVSPTNGVNGTAGVDAADTPDFSFDSWLNEISNSNPEMAELYPSAPATGGDFSTLLSMPTFDAAPTQEAAPLSSPSGVKRKLEGLEIASDESPSTKKKR